METILNYTGLVIGLILAVVGIILQIKSSKRKELYWSEQSTNLIKGYSSMFEDLKILYKDKEIENLTVSKIAIWNGGNETLQLSDIQTVRPLHMAALDDETEILDAKVVAASNNANQFTVIPGENGKWAVFTFDYLNTNEGAVMQVIHTGNSPSNLYVMGQVKGIKEIKYKITKKGTIDQLMMDWFAYFNLLMLLGISILFAYSILVPTEAVQKSVLGSAPVVYKWAIILLTIGLWIIWGRFVLRKFRGSAKLPKELDVFEKSVYTKKTDQFK